VESDDIFERTVIKVSMTKLKIRFIIQINIFIKFFGGFRPKNLCRIDFKNAGNKKLVFARKKNISYKVHRIDLGALQIFLRLSSIDAICVPSVDFTRFFL